MQGSTKTFMNFFPSLSSVNKKKKDIEVNKRKLTQCHLEVNNRAIYYKARGIIFVIRPVAKKDHFKNPELLCMIPWHYIIK